MSIIKPNNNEGANFSKSITSDLNKKIKVKISEDAKGYILDRNDVITMEIETTYV